MIKKRTFIIKILVMCLNICLLYGGISSLKVNASEFNIENYKNVIEKVNILYNTKFAITDMDSFISNICNKMEPEEFEKILMEDAANIQNAPTEVKIEAKEMRPSIRAGRNEVVEYTALITQGSWGAVCYALIETTFFSTGSPKFVSYRGGGVKWNDTDTTYNFKTSSVQCVTIAPTNCYVMYKGFWKIPATGIADLTSRTYYITYRP